MSHELLMPKATAVWLIDNTALTFEQIAQFCNLHSLEVKGIADGDVAQGIKGFDPVSNGQLTREELEKGEADATHLLEIAKPKVELPEVKKKKSPRYTPVSRRQERPNAIAWLLRYHPEIPDSQVMKLVGTTKTTISAIRDRSHWNSSQIKPVDPVALGLCSQIDLDTVVQKAAVKVERERLKAEKAAIKAGTLLPTEETTEPAEEAVAAEIIPDAPSMTEGPTPKQEDVFANSPEPSRDEEEKEEEIDADSVFAKLKDLNPGGDSDS